MSAIEKVEVRLHVAAPREAVWAMYTDYPGWTGWAGLGRVSVEPGDSGGGPVRVIRNVGPPVREELLAVEAPGRLTYRVLSGIPLRDHLGETLFEEDGAGTLVTWRCRFVCRIPGLGPLFRVGIRYVFRRTLGRLARRVRP